MNTPKILIVEDHGFTRQTLAYEFKKNKQTEFLGAVENGKEAIEFIKKNKPEIILMDIDMPIMNGIEATKIIKKEYPEMLIIMLTAYQEKEKVLAAFSSGANAYCVKNIKTEELIKVIDIISDGGIWFDSKIAKFIYDIMKKIEEKSSESKTFKDYNISDREKEVINLISEGLSNLEIAEKLFISKNTVRNHISNIINKLSVKDRTQIALLAAKIQD